MDLKACALVVLACAALAGCSDDSEEDVAGCQERDGGVVAVYSATDPRGGPVASRTVDATVDIMCNRAKALGMAVDIRRRGDQVEVRVDATQVDKLARLAAPGRLAFYDWEPNVFGDPNQPMNDLAQAIRAAARAKPRAEEEDVPADGPSDDVERRFRGDARRIRAHYDVQNDSFGDKYYALDSRGQLVRPGGTGSYDANAFSTQRRTPSPGGRLVEVPRGVVIVKAEPPLEATQSTPAQYFVIEDDSELTGSDIERPAQDFDQQTQEPIVTMEFTDAGKKAFARVTERIAKRGQETLPQPGSSPEDRFQRFMIALDGQILSLATIDFIRNPEGISGATGAQINGLGSIEETKDLARNLRIGPLPVRLQRVR